MQFLIEYECFQGFYVGNGIDTNSLGFSETMNPGFESRTMSLLEKI
jgi:hypothetical protein